MAKQMTLTDRDIDLLYVLGAKTGKLTMQQIERTWFAGLMHGRVATSNRIRKLKSAGLIETICATIHPEIELVKPIFEWAPGKESPNAEKVAWKLRSRWNKPPVRTSIALPTKKAISLSGGDAFQVRSRALLHDIHVSGLYLKFRETDERMSASWIHESSLYLKGFGRNGKPLPDAIVGFDRPIAIDFGGSYSAGKVKHLHRAYASNSIAYQLW